MSLFLQQVVNAVALGSIYSLVALGLTLVYGVLHIPNFAHGALYMLGAYTTFFLVTTYGVHYVPAIGVAAATVALLGILLERIAFRPLEGRSPVHAMIVALGVLLFFQGSAAAVWGADFRRLPTPFAGVVSFGGLTITEQRVIVIAAAVATMIALHVFLTRTLAGMAIEATAQDREGARVVGIDTRRVALLT